MQCSKYALISILAAILVVLSFGPAAAGVVKVGHFQAEIVGAEEVYWDSGQNDGYNSTWYEYPQGGGGGGGMILSEDPLPWWNEWWYNDPWLDPGGKWVRIEFNYGLIDPNAPGDVFVTINWTNGGWVGQNAPPIYSAETPDPEQYIERLSDYGEDWFFHLDPYAPDGSWDSGVYWLPIDYNPEWVSVDVQGMNVAIWGGIIEHQCVPIPAAAWLMGSGLIGLAGIRRKLRN